MTVKEKINLLAPQAEKMPGVTVVHEIEGFKPLFMTSNGLKLLGLTLEELISIGEDYRKRFFNRSFMEEYLRKLRKFMNEEEKREIYIFPQQVKLKDQKDFVWYISSIKVFHSNAEDLPTHTITTAFPIDAFPRTLKRAERLMAEDQFCKNNLQKYLSLSERAKEVLRLVALGKSSSEIADELNISVNTVNSHRKSIKQKLNISSTYEFNEYALSFDLI